MNLAFKLNNLESSINQSLAMWQEVNARVTALDNRIAALERDTQVQTVKHEVTALRTQIRDLELLVDASVGIPAEMEVAPATPVTTLKASPAPAIFYDGDGTPMVLAQPGVRDAVEARGYLVTGTLSKGNEIFLKLQLNRTPAATKAMTVSTPPKPQVRPESFHAADGTLMILAAPGVKEDMEAKGYQIAGTDSTSGQTHFKLRKTR
jgi:hypothetical protein